jgi:LAGLIDADG DNA endonuclease family
MKNNNINNNINLKNLKILPGDLHSILIGILLGDGSIYNSSPSSNSRFEMSFGQDYKQFAISIENLFKEYMKTDIKEVKVKSNIKDKVYTNFRLKTMTLPLFNTYHNMFYKLNIETGKYIKIVPNNIFALLNIIILAYLIMSDGNFDKSKNRVRIYTNSYTKDDVTKLADAIINKLGIYVGVLHDRKDQ